jgi:hypothetical protein
MGVASGERVPITGGLERVRGGRAWSSSAVGDAASKASVGDGFLAHAKLATEWVNAGELDLEL